MKSVVVLQSNYLPWKGYFDLINDADVIIFYDDLQYTKNDWRNRNKIKTLRGTEWITVPVGTNIKRRICDVELADPGWQIKHWKILLHNYYRAPHFARYRPFFEDVFLRRRWSLLSDLNQYLIRVIATDFLEVQAVFQDSREYSLSGRKQDRVLDLLLQARANRYISGPAAKSYIDSERFAQAGIEVVWKDYTGYPEYPQRFLPFRHEVSIVDLMFNVGADASWYIWGWRNGQLEQ